MEMQPNRNMAVENQLQAVQLGASLYDRAQTQKRMMEQFQLQTADQVMRQRQSDLQNKIQSNAYAQAIQEQDAQVAEFEAFQTFNNDVSNFLNSREVGAAMPAIPRFKSKTFNQEASKAIGGLEQYSARSELMKQQTKMAAFTDQLEAKRIDDARKYNALTRTPEGKYVIDDSLIARKRVEEEQLGKAAKLGTIGRLGTATVQSLIDSGQIPEEIANQALLAAQSGEKSKMGAVEKNTELFIRSANAKAKASGKTLTPFQEAELRQTFIGGGGRLKALEAKTATKLEDEFAVMETIDGFQDGISEFEARYPNKKFTDFLGAIPSTEIKIRSLIQTEKDPMKQEALGLLADFMGVVNRTARTTSGLNVTESEGKRITQEIGGSFDKNSIIKLDRYRKRIEQSARGTIGRNIDKSLPAFYERWSTTPFGTRTTAAYSVPGVSFQSETEESQGGGSFNTATPPVSGQAPSLDTSYKNMSLEAIQNLIQKIRNESK